MKMLLKKLVPGALLLFLSSGVAFAQPKIATIDLQKVFSNYWKTKQANDMLQDQFADVLKTDKEMRAKWQKVKEEYQKLLTDASDPVVSAEEKDKRKKAAEDKFKEMKDDTDNIEQFERTAEATRRAQLQRTHDNILSEIRTVIAAKAKAGGFALVLDTSDPIYVADVTQLTPTVLYSSGENDFTDAVLAQLNAGAPVTIPKPNGKTNGPPAISPADEKKK